ncbi:MAG: sigma 54-interacting transcriptional regulator, partial [Myxococcales bacterium]|nr:sigma 54-interacting transcriptional regulator [Myxococcales bacterium]
MTSLVLHHRSGAHILPLAVGADVVVGRGEDCTVVLDDRGLSRRHASFRLTAEGHVTVTDLGSTNGMFVHGKRVTDAVLGPGDEITLAGVTASLHSLRLRAGAILELEGHEAFRRRLDAELARARFFRRPTAVLMVRALEETAAPLRRWSPLVQERVRIVDSLAMYSDATLELLLPEASLVEAVGIARAITTGVSPALGCGVASYPAAASSAEELLEQARDLMRATTAQQPVRVANEGVRTLSAPDADAPVCESAPMRELYRTAARVAKSPLPILILAETGAGKEVLAHFVHDTSPRRSAPMVSVNCGAIPETLLESTLFGHEKGAFTGAATQHRGVFESAAGGTVFLDEIGELPSAAQAALLRVLEQKAVVRVGATKPIEADVRVIAATHRNLAAMVQEGRFRQDLLYRLNAMTLTIPPLRERTEEIALLADRFLRRANAANGTALRGIS